MIVKKNVSMAEYCSFKAGEKAAFLLMPETETEIKEAFDFAKSEGLPYMIMGNGTNLLFAKDYPGVVIRPKAESISKIANDAAKKGFAGLEFASGIPGSLGGAVYMNAGAYGGEMSKVLKSVTSLDDKGHIHVRTPEECGFSYRRSVFMDNKELILSADFELYRDDPEEIKRRIADLSRERSAKQPLSYPSAGSFFKRPEGYFAGKLIQDAGLKGCSIGGAQVSELHAGFIINRGGASAEDIVSLMKHVQKTVFDKFGVELKPEVQIIGL